MQSVYNWERKKATPRKEQIAAIVALRGIGKKEAHQRLNVDVPRDRPRNPRTITRASDTPKKRRRHTDAKSRPARPDTRKSRKKR
jgi:hypothetical protein